MITPSSFRDKYLDSVLIGYSWESSAHYAEICVSNERSPSRKFRIIGLTSYSINEDFSARYIEQCTLIATSDRVYLSLDPHTEDKESDLDNYSFVGKEIVAK
jgi:hypothetical protein